MTQAMKDKIAYKVRRFGEYRLPNGDYIYQPFPDEKGYSLRDGKDHHTIAFSNKLSEILELIEED